MDEYKSVKYSETNWDTDWAARGDSWAPDDIKEGPSEESGRRFVWDWEDDPCDTDELECDDDGVSGSVTADSKGNPLIESTINRVPGPGPDERKEDERIKAIDARIELQRFLSTLAF